MSPENSLRCSNLKIRPDSGCDTTHEDESCALIIISSYFHHIIISLIISSRRQGFDQAEILPEYLTHKETKLVSTYSFGVGSMSHYYYYCIEFFYLGLNADF